MATKKTFTYWLVRTIVTLFMLGAAAVSFLHIVHTAEMLGLGPERWTVPFIIDGLAVLGLVGRSGRFAESTKKAGLKLMCGAGLLSLAANIAAGENAGQRIYGALIVAAFITAEWYGGKLSPAPAAAPVEQVEQVADEAKAARRSAAAKKAAVTRAANKAAADADKAATAERRRIARMERQMREAFDTTIAPVSPAPGEAAAYL